jgi:hypothetical protein
MWAMDWARDGFSATISTVRILPSGKHREVDSR